MRTLIDNRDVSVEGIKRMGNCRLVKTQKLVNQILMAIETEIEERSGRGGGGLK